MNPSLALLAQYLRKEPKEVETAWRDAKQFRRTEGGKDYRLAWEHLGKLLKIPARPRVVDKAVTEDDGRQLVWHHPVLDTRVHVHGVGAVFMKVETTRGNIFVIPSCFLLVDGNTTTHDIAL